ncbi:uncharacterized protein LOC134196627 isoform X2 [Corticium candelabrum]|uniref:uncharacterized protein LOC134196627 isoform X2 n=1 Tax=Corticium candelabrum TaxID=121492 RepID=UPI002E25BE8F|nr:uncharacterized protein LOC134196627 isoform X2 [Corticium candelabrum]
MFQLQPTDDEITDDSESVVSSEQVVSSDSSSDGDGTDDEEALFIREDSDDATLPPSPQHHSPSLPVSHLSPPSSSLSVVSIPHLSLPATSPPATSSPASSPSSSTRLRLRRPLQQPVRQSQHPSTLSSSSHSSDSESEPAASVDRRTDALDVLHLCHIPPDDDYQLQLPPFAPRRQPGFYPPQPYPTDAVGFFKLFFTDEMIEIIRTNSNIKGEDNCRKRNKGKSGGRRGEGRFRPVTTAEMNSLIGLLIYMGLVKVPELSDYWRTTFPFYGLWARRFMSRSRFDVILSVLQLENPRTAKDREADPLRSVRTVCEALRRNCMEYGQPHARVSLDERMVKAKGRFAFWQYMRNNPVKWGVKLYCVCDSISAYTYNFDIYTGKETHQPSVAATAGMTTATAATTSAGSDRKRQKTICHAADDTSVIHRTVMRMMDPLLDQGYIVYTDQQFTSGPLFKELYNRGTMACGAVQINRKGVPPDMKNTCVFAKSPRGMTKVRRGFTVYIHRVAADFFCHSHQLVSISLQVTVLSTSRILQSLTLPFLYALSGNTDEVCMCLTAIARSKNGRRDHKCWSQF